MQFEFDRYKALLQSVAALSRLYSDSKTALLHPRFIEKLYVHASGAKDFSRKDMSFDAMAGSCGIGIKTFVANSALQSKSEKIAEFTSNATKGDFAGLNLHALAVKASEMRNARVNSDASEYSIDLDSSIYHCLVRINGSAFVHEEPYALIDIDQIQPTDSKGCLIKKFPETPGGHSYFTDGSSKYVYNVAKNVLYKQFELSKFSNSELIPLSIIEDILDKITGMVQLDSKLLADIGKIEPSADISCEKSSVMDYVILPLYGTRSSQAKVVYEKSGINQWNADGRPREFGEAYIPVPMAIHNEHPDFFPPRHQKFRIKLPDEKVIIASICQSNGKALMSDPNKEICDWLFRMIDFSPGKTLFRFKNNIPYTYEDLKRIGKDSVKVTKVKGKPYDYEIESMPLDSFEEFINGSGAP